MVCRLHAPRARDGGVELIFIKHACIKCLTTIHLVRIVTAVVDTVATREHAHAPAVCADELRRVTGARRTDFWRFVRVVTAIVIAIADVTRRNTFACE